MDTTKLEPVLKEEAKKKFVEIIPGIMDEMMESIRPTMERFLIEFLHDSMTSSKPEPKETTYPINKGK